MAMNERQWEWLKHLYFVVAVVLLASLFTGCSSLNNAIKSASDKNIAAGSDTWGGKIQMEFFSFECPLPNVILTFGRTRQWYVSLKDPNSAKTLSDVVKASNSALSVSAGGVGIKNEMP
jgi:hypothetical protein